MITTVVVNKKPQTDTSKLDDKIDEMIQTIQWRIVASASNTTVESIEEDLGSIFEEEPNHDNAAENAAKRKAAEEKRASEDADTSDIPFLD